MTSTSDIVAAPAGAATDQGGARRLPGLDVIRVAAILLVLGRHLPMRPATVTTTTEWFLERWFQGGWVGVDLFFVLSGFLVAGLLFAELKATGRIKVLRFYGRRGFKIYPAFYFFIAVSALVLSSPRYGLRLPQWIHELLFIQNYTYGVWGHTWSLAVEEHFYLVLPLLLVALGIGGTGSRRDTTLVVAAGVIAAVGCLAARIATTTAHPKYDNYVHLFPTHLRADALMCGVVIAYFWHFHQASVQKLFPLRVALLWTGVPLLLIPLVVPLETDFMHTVGLTTNYLGGAAVLLAVLLSNSTSPTVRALGWFGPYTYSIYLWHEFMPAVVPTDRGYGVMVVTYVASALAAGWAMAKLVEWPALRLRERVLPRR